ncbi:14528_t:CDS:2, partial [Cetraspora pellucida]
VSVKMSISTSISDYIDDDDIYSVDVYDKPPRPDESTMWDYFMIETTEKSTFDVCQICKEKNIDVSATRLQDFKFINIKKLKSEDEFDTQIISKQLHQSLQPPVTTEDLCDLVKAASYLSLQEY